MNEEELKVLEEELKRMFPDAIAVKPGEDGCCPICKELGLEGAEAPKVPRRPGVFSVFLHTSKARN